jgi:hypothetical protein
MNHNIFDQENLYNLNSQSESQIFNDLLTNPEFVQEALSWFKIWLEKYKVDDIKFDIMYGNVIATLPLPFNLDADKLNQDLAVMGKPPIAGLILEQINKNPLILFHLPMVPKAFIGNSKIRNYMIGFGRLSVATDYPKPLLQKKGNRLSSLFKSAPESEPVKFDQKVENIRSENEKEANLFRKMLNLDSLVDYDTIAEFSTLFASTKKFLSIALYSYFIFSKVIVMISKAIPSLALEIESVLPKILLVDSFRPAENYASVDH